MEGDCTVSSRGMVTITPAVESVTTFQRREENNDLSISSTVFFEQKLSECSGNGSWNFSFFLLIIFGTNEILRQILGFWLVLGDDFFQEADRRGTFNAFSGSVVLIEEE